ncbi:MAG: hypothetical protein IPG74_14385 [Flavobacteriales bacterium]|nr:hypothetical protein [Flavobacteriales bacterium]
MVNGRAFFRWHQPIAAVRAIGDSLWIGPSVNYATFDPNASSHARQLALLHADMELNKEMVQYGTHCRLF